ncbi:MAG: hypothetical protein ACYS47_09200, partial [Planctomycetota bacterium]
MSPLLILLLLAQAPEITKGPRVQDKPLGFQIRLFTDTAELPPRRTPKPAKPDLTWYESQVERSWVVQRGGKHPGARLRILLGRLRAPSGEAVKAQAQGDPSAAWGEKTLADWVASFSEMEAQGDPFEQKIGRLSAKSWRLRSDSHQGLGFLLRREDASFLLLFKHPSGWDLEKAILESAKSFRFTSPKKSRAKELKLPGRKKKLNPALDAARDASADRVARSIEGLPSWWYHPTDHFIVTGNVDPKAHRAAIGEFVTQLEKIRRAYGTLLPGKAPVKAVSVVKTFSSR